MKGSYDPGFSLEAFVAAFPAAVVLLLVGFVVAVIVLSGGVE